MHISQPFLASAKILIVLLLGIYSDVLWIELKFIKRAEPKR